MPREAGAAPGSGEGRIRWRPADFFFEYFHTDSKNGSNGLHGRKLHSDPRLNHRQWHLVVISEGGGNTGYISSVTGGGGTWLYPAGSQISHGGVRNHLHTILRLQLPQLLDNFSERSEFNVLVLYEYSFTLGSTSLDAIGTSLNNAGGTTVAGTTLSITGTNDVIVQGSNAAVLPGIASPYGNYQYNSGNELGYADGENISSGTGPLWNTSTTSSNTFQNCRLDSSREI